MPRAKTVAKEEGCSCLFVPKKIAMAIGSFVALMHLFWALLVASGVAQAWVDWMLSMHMIYMPVVIGPFNAWSALSLLVMTFIAGYIMGWVFALVWNYFQKCKCGCKWC